MPDSAQATPDQPPNLIQTTFTDRETDHYQGAWEVPYPAIQADAAPTMWETGTLASYQLPVIAERWNVTSASAVCWATCRVLPPVAALAVASHRRYVADVHEPWRANTEGP